MKPRIKGRIHIDEKYVKVGKVEYYDLNAIDSKTKFVLAHLLVEHRTKEKVVEFLSQVKGSCYDQILAKYHSERHKPVKKRELVRFVCDGFENYRNAFNKLFYRVAKLTFGVPIKAKVKGTKYNNNPIERYNEEIEQRYKIMRNFKNSVYAGSFLEMRRIVHNFVNPHMQLKGNTPAERANVKIIDGRNKLLSLIRYVHLTIK